MKKLPSQSQEELTGAVSLRVAARQAGIPRREVRRLLQQGKAPFVQVRGQIRVPSAAVKQLATRR